MKRVNGESRKTPRYYRRWTPREDRALALGWGDASLEMLARSLGRTAVATYWRARQLGLPCGCPRGFEYLTDAATRTGFETSQLRRLLDAAGVRLRRAISNPTSVSRLGGRPKRHYHFVDPIEVDDAVAAWSKQETVEEAGRRHGLSGETVRRLLVAAGHAPPRFKFRWRVDPALVDELVAVRRQLASVRTHAFRVGIGHVALGRWLRDAGLLGPKAPGVEVRLAQDVVDEVVAARRPTSRARRAA